MSPQSRRPALPVQEGKPGRFAYRRGKAGPFLLRQQLIEFGQPGGGTDFVEALIHFVSGQFSLTGKILKRVGQIKRNVARRLIKDLLSCKS